MTLDQLDVYADVLCPYAYVGMTAFFAARNAAGRDAPVLVARAWPLELINGKPLSGPVLAPKIAALRASIAIDRFAGFDPERFPRSSLPALVSTAAAYRTSATAGQAFALAVREALFERGEDVADPEVLRRLRRDHGVPDPEPLDEDRVRADWGEGERRGVRGSPHYFLPGGGDFFCPFLDISYTADAIEIRANEDRFRDFIRRALA